MDRESSKTSNPYDLSRVFKNKQPLCNPYHLSTACAAPPRMRDARHAQATACVPLLLTHAVAPGSVASALPMRAMTCVAYVYMLQTSISHELFKVIDNEEQKSLRVQKS